MRLHVIVHAPFEKLGAIKNWAKDKAHTITETHIYNNENLPPQNEFDFLIVMGGPQSPLQTGKFPYLLDEIAFIKSTVKAKKPIIGICLGAQLIGEALGAKTEKSEFKEIGLYPVQLTKEGLEDPVFKTFGREFNVMHWHNDMPGIAKNAVLLAKSKGCAHQAFRYGDRIYGLQFHLEMTSEILHDLIGNCEKDLTPNKYVRSKEEMVLIDFTFTNEKMYKLLNHLEHVSFPEIVAAKL